MALAVIRSRALSGVRADPVAVEVHLGNGLPCFTLVGLPDTEVRESRDRVRAALQNAGLDFPARRITVNLAPADLPKSSGRFDLPIAVGILVASGQLPADGLENLEFAGELALTGELRGIRGALPTALAARSAGNRLILPRANAEEAGRVPGGITLAAPDLQAVCSHLAGRAPLAQATAIDALTSETPQPCLSDVRGQAQAKRVLELAAAGGHSLLLQGPPGTGKTMLAQRLPGLLPPMTGDEALTSASVRALGSNGMPAADWGQRPFRSPHHTVSAAALVGGGVDPRPGEVSLAHLGVLFLDELPEFERRCLEVLREPLELGEVRVSRAARQAVFPAKFHLVAAMNPCPCGYLGHPSRQCACTPDQIARYRGRISGPLLDRIDLHASVPAPSTTELLDHQARGEDSATVRQRVLAAHARQIERQGVANAALDAAGTERHASPDQAGRALLERAVRVGGLSARWVHRTLRIARTIADLSAHDQVAVSDLAEALQYRPINTGLGATPMQTDPPVFPAPHA